MFSEFHGVSYHSIFGFFNVRGKKLRCGEHCKGPTRKQKSFSGSTGKWLTLTRQKTGIPSEVRRAAKISVRGRDTAARQVRGVAGAFCEKHPALCGRRRCAASSFIHIFLTEVTTYKERQDTHIQRLFWTKREQARQVRPVFWRCTTYSSVVKERCSLPKMLGGRLRHVAQPRKRNRATGYGRESGGGRICSRRPYGVPTPFQQVFKVH